MSNKKRRWRQDYNFTSYPYSVEQPHEQFSRPQDWPSSEVASERDLLRYEQRQRKIAEMRVNARLRFYKHLSFYLIVNGFLWGTALFSALTMSRYGYSFSGRTWFPLLFSLIWTIWLVSHWWRVFGDSLRQRLLDQELRRIGYQQQQQQHP